MVWHAQQRILPVLRSFRDRSELTLLENRLGAKEPRPSPTS